MRKLLTKKLPGVSWGLVLAPWELLWYCSMIYLIAAVGTRVVQAVIFVAYTVVYARHAAVFPNMVDPLTGDSVSSQFVAEISDRLGVTTYSITNSSTPPDPAAVSIGEFDLDMWSTDGNYVTTTAVYGLSFPGTGLFERVGFHPSPIPIRASFSFYREW